MVESAHVRGAKINRMAEIAADANDLKTDRDHSVRAVRRAHRDALRELSEEFDDPEAVEAVALPSDRLAE